MVRDFAAVSLIEYLSANSQPCLAVRVGESAQEASPLHIVFSNDAFNIAHNSLLERLTSRLSYDVDAREDARFARFRSFITQDHSTGLFCYEGTTWTGTTIAGKYRILCAAPTTSPIATTQKQTGRERDRNQHVRSPARLTSANYEFLRRDADWSKSPLGPFDTWPTLLLDSLAIILNSPDPCAVYWGEDRINIYNEAMIPLIKGLHPDAMGAPAKIAYEPFWSFFDPILAEVERTGIADKAENVPLSFNRAGKLEEAYFTNSFFPIYANDGKMAGMFNQTFETTSQTIAQKRMHKLLEHDRRVKSIKGLDAYWSFLTESLSNNGDFIFATIYVPHPGPATGSIKNSSAAMPPREPMTWTLHQEPAMPVGSPQLTRQFSTNDGSQLSHVTGIYDEVKHREPLAASEIFGSSWNNSDAQVLLRPISVASKPDPAWCIVSVNPLRPYNKAFGEYMDLLVRHSEATATATFLVEQERSRLLKTALEAEQEKQAVSKELAAQILETQEKELRFVTFAKNAPVGIFILGPEGEILFANNAWHQLLKVDTAYIGDRAWSGHLHPDDVDPAADEWEKLKRGDTASMFEFRIVSNPENVTEDDEVTYLQSTAYTSFETDGKMKNVTGIVIDVSAQKLQEAETINRLAAAVEAKRVQENFMDIHSHELRNPLTAMLQCAEEAQQILQTYSRRSSKQRSMDDGDLSASINALNTIIYCGQHQKQILDDILTISKLDSDLLAIAPQPSDPSAVVTQALEIYASEIRNADIEVITRADNAVDTTDGSKLVQIDSGRVLQILMNLLGNAVKFTKTRPTRELKVEHGVAKDKPVFEGLHFAPSGRQRKQLTAGTTTLSTADSLYIWFSVTDTGPGLSAAEQDVLFGRFRQASPRTHGQYGGSGLGLFISRELTELHGGEIGLSSVTGQGSTFAFYVRGLPVSDGDTDMPGTPSTPGPAQGHRPIPARRSTSASTPGLSQDPASPSPNASTAISPSDTTITVLIVEDNLINQSVLKRQLRRLGFATHTADNGQQALDLLSRSQWCTNPVPAGHERISVSIVLCDLEMPVMSGLECVRHVREGERDGSFVGGNSNNSNSSADKSSANRMGATGVPMVAVTGNARSEQVSEALAAGFNEVVCKPYRIEALVPVIRGLVEQTERA